MGGVAAAIGAAVSDGFDAVKDIANNVVDIAADTAKLGFDVVWTATGNKWLDEKITGGLISNTYNGITDNLANMLHGSINGDWVQFRDATLATTTSAVAIVAIVFGGPWGIVAGTIILDAQYNNGEALGRTISVAGDIETATINTHYIDTYATEIQILITVAATLYAGSVAAPVINDFFGITALIAKWTFELDMLSAAYGGYQTYMAIQAIRDSQEYWKQKLREAEAYYRKLIAQANAAKNLWFDMMTNPDMINRIQAGGDLFNLGAGHDLFSITSVAEPRFALGLIDTSDSEMDKLMNNRYFAQSAGSDGFRVN